jgi:nucleotide-binding universal stress UspA family protein
LGLGGSSLNQVTTDRGRYWKEGRMPTLVQSVDIQLQSILIATDFSQASEKPLYHALAIARRYGAKIHLTHIVSALGFQMAGADAMCAAEEAARRDAHRLEHRLATTGAFAGLQHQMIVRSGEVWPTLEEIIRQEHVDLIVLGTHGRQGIGKVLLGSVAEQIFRHAGCPVLTMGPGAYQEPRVDRTRADRPFLFATDFGESSLRALPYAISFANQLAARLVLFHAVPKILARDDFKVSTPNDMARLQELARGESVQRLKHLVRNVRLNVQPEFVVSVNRLGPVSEDILKVAEKLKADLIVMGSHRSKHLGTASHTPWTTVSAVVCGANCPILTVRHGGDS